MYDSVLWALSSGAIHRKQTTVCNADLIVVFSHGRGVETGIWSALMEKQGAFPQLAQALHIE